MDVQSALSTKAAIDLTPFYPVIGGLVVAQFGTIITVIMWLMKATWKASAMNSDIERLKTDVNAAHQKLRQSGVKPDEPCADNKQTGG